RLPPPPLTCVLADSRQEFRSARPNSFPLSEGIRGREACTMGGRTVATIASPMLYAPETFSEEEADRLRPYFTNLEGPVFALPNLPEVVKGALFARYSRSDKSLRRLFLDEFVGDLDLTGDLTVDATVGLRRAEELYARVFLEY